VQAQKEGFDQIVEVGAVSLLQPDHTTTACVYKLSHSRVKHQQQKVLGMRSNTRKVGWSCGILLHRLHRLKSEGSRGSGKTPSTPASPVACCQTATGSDCDLTHYTLLWSELNLQQHLVCRVSTARHNHDTVWPHNTAPEQRQYHPAAGAAAGEVLLAAPTITQQMPPKATSTAAVSRGAADKVINAVAAAAVSVLLLVLLQATGRDGPG